MADAIPVHSDPEAAPKPTPKKTPKAAHGAAPDVDTGETLFIDFGPDDVKPSDFPGAKSVRKIPTHAAYEVLY
jgi:hypothetical protein